MVDAEEHETAARSSKWEDDDDEDEDDDDVKKKTDLGFVLKWGGFAFNGGWEMEVGYPIFRQTRRSKTNFCRLGYSPTQYMRMLICSFCWFWSR